MKPVITRWLKLLCQYHKTVGKGGASIADALINLDGRVGKCDFKFYNQTDRKLRRKLRGRKPW